MDVRALDATLRGSGEEVTGDHLSAANSHSDLGSRFHALSFNFLTSEGGGYCPALTWEAYIEWLDSPAVKTSWATRKSGRPQTRC